MCLTRVRNAWLHKETVKQIRRKRSYEAALFQERISTKAPTQENTLTEDTDQLKANKVVIDNEKSDQ